jgi:hypothetical protein
MSVMRNFLLFLFVFSLFATTSAKAAMTNDESTDAEYLLNSGYSQAMAEDIFMLKNRMNGQSIEPLYERNESVLVRGWRKFYSALDPSVSNDDDRLHHDIKMSPSITDL